MPVLVDSSIWIDYFRGDKNSDKLEYFIDENVLVTNDLILTELTPFLKIKQQQKIINLLKAIDKLELNINWGQLIDYQHKCLKKGINGVGIPNLIIAQNAIQNQCELYTLDNHFKMIQQSINLKLIN
ncbi:MAG: PIN domain-containing protein [Deltaproteobacteria bacterium]|uniref:PIN domain-containing protein n=1 Tax=Desulfobacula sp. TaxID=2593537 RepID=UPI0019A2A85F|nr:PIN domain-containing protein [Candidatus Desulfobacula maris]MBL6993163.1 PIN domain-containing protein [Desulfobacula sp.]